MALKQIVVELIGDTRKLQAGMKRAERSTGALMRTFRRLAGVMAGVFGARALYRFFRGTIDSTNALIKTAKGVGFTVDQYQQLTFALSQVGVEAGSAKIAIGDFQKRLSKAVAGTSPQFAKAFQEAGLDIRTLSKMAPAEAFNAAFMHLAGQINDPRIAGLFGNVFEEQSGKDMLKAARQLGIYSKAWEDYGRTVAPLSKEEEKRFENTQSQIQLMSLQWDRLKQKIVADAAPAILNTLQQLDDSGALKKMAEDIGYLIGKVTDLVEALGALRVNLPETDLAKALGGGITFEDGQTPQQHAEAAAEAMHRRRRYRPGLAKPYTDAQLQYLYKGSSSFVQNNTIYVSDAEIANRVRRLMEREKRMGLRD